LKKSVVRRREHSPDLTLKGRNGARGHLNGSTIRQDKVFGESANPFVSMMRNTALWARNFTHSSSTGYFDILGQHRTS
jgi:hypothetical protein